MTLLVDSQQASSVGSLSPFTSLTTFLLFPWHKTEQLGHLSASCQGESKKTAQRFNSDGKVNPTCSEVLWEF